MPGLLEDFRRLVGPPETPPPVADWVDIERRIGCVLPDEYKEWASEYTSLRLGDRMYITNYAVPFVRGAPSLNLAAASGALRTLTQRRPGRPLKDDEGEIVFADAGEVRFYPDEGGLLFWASTQDGEQFYWEPASELDRWRIIATDGADWWRFDGSFLEFLVGLADRSIDCPILPSEFFDPPTISELVAVRDDGTGAYDVEYRLTSKWRKPQ